MGDVDADERCIEEGAFDAIAIGRPMLADPDLPKKVAIGRPDKIRPCIACNQGCLLRLFQGLPSGCAVNPLIGRDKDYAPTPALVRKSVVVVGGGVAGCEISLDLVNKGHDVTIVEALPQILGSGPAVPLPNAMYLRDAFVHHGTPVLTDTRISSVTDAGAVVQGPDGVRTLPADTVVIAVGFKPNPSMAPDLRGHGYEVFEIGDGRHVGNILTAIWDAYEVAHTI